MHDDVDALAGGRELLQVGRVHLNELLVRLERREHRPIMTAGYIRNALGELDLDCKIGIATGQAFCGLVGSAQRCEYAMMGSSVNLAARLMGSCAPNEIRVDET